MIENCNVNILRVIAQNALFYKQTAIPLYLGWLPYLPCSSSLTATGHYVNTFFCPLLVLELNVNGLHSHADLAWLLIIKMFWACLVILFLPLVSNSRQLLLKDHLAFAVRRLVVALFMFVLRLLLFVLLKISLLIVLSFHCTPRIFLKHLC